MMVCGTIFSYLNADEFGRRDLSCGLYIHAVAEESVRGTWTYHVSQGFRVG